MGSRCAWQSGGGQTCGDSGKTGWGGGWGGREGCSGQTGRGGEGKTGPTGGAKRERGMARPGEGGVARRDGRGFVGAGQDRKVSKREGRRGRQGRVSKQRGRVKLVAWIMCACNMLGPLVLHPVPH
jgi:hypothetical protein